MEKLMFSKLILVGSILALTACSTVKTNDSEPIRNQKLSTSFTSEGIKIETDCAWYNFDKSKCNVVSIESTATVATNGGTANNRTTAMTRADLRARANVRHFLQEDITSSRVTSTIAKNIEKGSDRIKTKLNEGEVVSMSDTDASKDTNFAVRENSNDTAHQMTETVRANAQGILRGFRILRQEVTGPQEVTVTIRWDIDGDRSAGQLRQRFSN
jgi:hypothetical protein